MSKRCDVVSLGPRLINSFNQPKPELACHFNNFLFVNLFVYVCNLCNIKFVNGCVFCTFVNIVSTKLDLILISSLFIYILCVCVCVCVWVCVYKMYKIQYNIHVCIKDMYIFFMKWILVKIRSSLLLSIIDECTKTDNHLQT